MDQINDTTYGYIAKDDPEDRLKIEVGDSKEVDFKPQVKIMRWDNESNFSMRLVEQDVEVPAISTKDGVVEYKKSKVEASFYSVVPDAQNEYGCFEFDITLREKPVTNKIEFTIQSKELEFIYEPTMTQGEIDAHPHLIDRPDNVNGSYAVYHKSKTGHQLGEINYKAGVAFHIYRPKVIDAQGTWVWGVLNYLHSRHGYTLTPYYLA